MIMKTILLLSALFLLFFPLLLSAQVSGEIQGYIFDNKTKSPIPGASVYTNSKGNRQGSTTDENGKFVLKPLEAGTYSITIHYMGYDTMEYKGIMVYANNISRMNDIYIEEAISELGTAKVVAMGGGNYHAGVNEKMDFETFKYIPSGPGLNDILGAMTTNIQIDQRSNKVLVRGARPTSTSYVVDGMRMGDDPMLPSQAVGSIEIFTSGIPAQYGDFTGGVIVVKTKSFFDEYYKRLEKEELKTIRNTHH